MASHAPVLRDLVLVGGGHSHVGVLRRFAMAPEPGVRLTLISRDGMSPYSGMLPGYISGHYSFDEVHIDLDRLCRFAGARLIRAEVLGIDRASRRVVLKDRPAFAYDLLSLNIGSTPRRLLVPGASDHSVGVKPIHGFNERWSALHDRLMAGEGCSSVAIVGAGAAGVELAFAIQWRVARDLAHLGRQADSPRITLYSASQTVLPNHSGNVRSRIERLLAARGIEVCAGAPVERVEPKRLLWDGQWREHDEIAWVTQAGPAPWLADTGLALDAQGFVAVDDCLRSRNDPQVFAAGDIAGMPVPLEKAGVFAVRMGRPLADNLRRALRGETLRRYRPQRHWLALLATGDRYAVASRGRWAAEGAWVWRWKDWIDRRFMRRFSDFAPAGEAMTQSVSGAVAPKLALTAQENSQALSVLAMRCGGCGAKVGADLLSRVIARLDPGTHEDVMIGLDAPDDAAVIAVPPGQVLVQTVDFFRAFIEDPWIFGQIAANHALSDLHAMQARPQSALAVATIPPGLDAKVEELLFQMMSGALEVLRAAGCALTGGHTAEGQELALGFAVNGLADASLDTLTRKTGLAPGQALILTKALGTGTLLVAREALAASCRSVEMAIATMLQSNAQAARCLHAHGARACTDVTGFGLIGHLMEMTRASGVDARLVFDDIPALPGAIDSLRQGHVSSLQANNLKARAAVQHWERHANDPRWPLLFDPQTSGGLLAGVPVDRAQACARALHALGYGSACIIGEVREVSQGDAPIVLA